MPKDTLQRNHSSIVTIKEATLESDISHVIAKSFVPNENRLKNLISKIDNLSNDEADIAFKQVIHSFSTRHKNYDDLLDAHYKNASEIATIPDSWSPLKKKILGAYCTNEYSFEAAALFNPSIVEHPDQSNLKAGDLRFIMSLRATGEGHISSVIFRSGIIDATGDIKFDSNNNFFETPKPCENTIYNKSLFIKQLSDRGVNDDVIASIFSKLDDNFTKNDFAKQVENLNIRDIFRAANNDNAWSKIDTLLRANYDIQFSAKSDINERVIFPTSTDESGGIEDARFVRFIEDDGKIIYRATYTAYSNPHIQPKMIETEDFLTFKTRTLSGSAAVDKGFALFPRKINGKYAMLSRQDGENNYIMFSNDLYRWDNMTPLKSPNPSWAFMQEGNCGSPIETEKGWLMITHGVGMMREYSIGALLLDLNDPSKVIGVLKEPLLVPEQEEREGYVPNVVYSCGALTHNGNLILPYAASDQRSLIATVNTAEILRSMDLIPKNTIVQDNEIPKQKQKSMSR